MDTGVFGQASTFGCSEDVVSANMESRLLNPFKTKVSLRTKVVLDRVLWTSGCLSDDLISLMSDVEVVCRIEFCCDPNVHDDPEGITGDLNEGFQVHGFLRFSFFQPFSSFLH